VNNLNNATPSPSDRRTERRLRVRLPIGVRGTDRTGKPFEEKTFCEDLCRGGMAFVLSRVIEPGSDIEIRLPLPSPSGKKEGPTEFATRGQVRHVISAEAGSVVGVAFVGPRLNRLFVSESALVS
jgi:hypothetical protein